jgi:tRNA(fMet)-specific endonuclease VapC
MARVVLDTSAWIQLERQILRQDLVSESDELIMAAAALAELKVAVERTSRNSRAREWTQNLIQAFVSSSRFAAIDEETAAVFAKLKAHCLKTGKPRGINDLWIAASAIQHNAELLSLDSSAVFEDLPGLKLRR